MIALLTLTLAAAAQTQPTPEQILRLISTQQEALKDVSFYYEGKFRVLPESGVEFGKEPAWFDQEFQGLYAFRNDGWIYQEIYTRHGDKSSKRSAIIDGKGAHIADGKAKLDDNSKSKPLAFSDPFILLEPASVHRVFYQYLLAAVVKRGVDGVSVEGWDDVDGRKCVKVRIRMFSQYDQSPSKLVWIDPERGAHPLKIESWWIKGELRSRIKVQLKSFKDALGSEVWLPNSATVETFHWNRRFYDRPVTRETLGLVQGSVLINAGLTDSQMRNPRLRVKNAPPGFRAKQTEFNNQAGRADTLDEGSVHPVSLQANLDSMLARAEEQSRALDASRASSAPWDWTFVGIPLAVALCGACVFGGSMWLRGKR